MKLLGVYALGLATGAFLGWLALTDYRLDVVAARIDDGIADADSVQVRTARLVTYGRASRLTNGGPQ